MLRPMIVLFSAFVLLSVGFANTTEIEAEEVISSNYRQLFSCPCRCRSVRNAAKQDCSRCIFKLACSVLKKKCILPNGKKGFECCKRPGGPKKPKKCPCKCRIKPEDKVATRVQCRSCNFRQCEFSKCVKNGKPGFWCCDAEIKLIPSPEP